MRRAWIVVLWMLVSAPAWAQSGTFNALSTDCTLYGSDTTYATAGTTYAGNDDTTTVTTSGQDRSAAVFDRYRLFLDFDVSTGAGGPPSGATITSMTLTCTMSATSSFTSTNNFDVQIRDFPWTAPLLTNAVTNYANCINPSNAPLDPVSPVFCNPSGAGGATVCSASGTVVTSGPLSTSYVTPGAAAHARFCLTSSRDASGTSPPNSPGQTEYVGWKTSESGVPCQLALSWFTGPTPTPSPTITQTATHTPNTTPTPLPTCYANETPPCAPRCLQPG
jgi:hypothetical protein